MRRAKKWRLNMKQHKILIEACVEYLAFYLCRFNLAPILSILMAYFGVTHREAGALASVIFISYAVALLPAGFLGDKFGPKKIIASGAAISVSSNILFAYTPSFSLALIIQLCNGLGQGMAWGPLTRLMSNWYPKEKMGFVMSVLSIPPAVGPVLAYVTSAYLATLYDWRTAFLYPSLVLLILTGMFWLLVRDRPSKTTQEKKNKGLSTKRRFFLVLSNRNIWLVAFAYLCLSAVGRGLLIWLPTYLVEKMGLPLLSAAVLAGVVTLGGVGTMFVGTWLADVKLGGKKRVVIVSSFVSAAPVILVLPYVADTGWVLVVFGLIFALLYFGGGLYFAYPSVFLPTEAVGTASGLIDTLAYVGNFLGTLLIGLILDVYHSYDPVFVVMTIIAVSGAAFASRIER